MKKNQWYTWFILAGIWIIAAIVNYFDGSDNYFTFQIITFLVLGVCQLICERHGEKGKKIFKYIMIGVLVLVIVYLAVLIWIMVK